MASRVIVNVSSRELKHKDGDVIDVTSKGNKVGEFIYSDINHINLTSEQTNVIVESNYNTRSATQVRTSATSVTSPYKAVTLKMKEKGLSEVETAKVLAYIEKMKQQ